MLVVMQLPFCWLYDYSSYKKLALQKVCGLRTMLSVVFFWGGIVAVLMCLFAGIVRKCYDVDPYSDILFFVRVCERPKLYIDPIG